MNKVFLSGNLTRDVEGQARVGIAVKKDCRIYGFSSKGGSKRPNTPGIKRTSFDVIVENVEKALRRRRRARRRRRHLPIPNGYEISGVGIIRNVHRRQGYQANPTANCPISCGWFKMPVAVCADKVESKSSKRFPLIRRKEILGDYRRHQVKISVTSGSYNEIAQLVVRLRAKVTISSKSTSTASSSSRPINRSKVHCWQSRKNLWKLKLKNSSTAILHWTQLTKQTHALNIKVTWTLY